MTPQRRNELFAQALIGEYIDPAGQGAAWTLTVNGDREIFDQAAEWCQSNEPLKRARGAAILGELMFVKPATPERPYPEIEYLYREESFPIVARTLDSEQDPLVIRSAIHALACMGRQDAVAHVLRHEMHPGEEVRLAIASGLVFHANHPAAVQCLLRLMRDSDHNVRDKAVIVLGIISHLDTPEIRDSLADRLNDPCVDVRESTITSLAKRKDSRIVPTLLAILAATDEHVYALAVEAAEWLLGWESSPEELPPSKYRAAIIKRFGQ